MKQEYSISSETLNAFVDDQLLIDDKERVYQAMEHNKSLQNYICRIRTVHEMVQDAYHQEQLPPRISTHHLPFPSRNLLASAALLLLFFTGGLVGWLCHAQVNEAQPGQVAAATADIPRQPLRNVLLHISGDEPEQISSALTLTKRLLQDAHQSATPINIEVLANEKGVELLRANNSTAAVKLSALASEYDNVRFTICAKALKRIEEEQGSFTPIPEAQIVPSAIDEIVTRMESGWRYIHV